MTYAAGNDPLPWDFRMDPAQTGWQAETAFWMMWFSQRTFSADPQAIAAELAAVGFDQVRLVSVPNTGLQALIARVPDQGIVLAFRGTVDYSGWCTNLNLGLAPLNTQTANPTPSNEQQVAEDGVELGVEDDRPQYDGQSDHPQQVHRGFQEALDSGWSEILAIIQEMTAEKTLPIWVTGHSLGGALATLASPRLKAHGFDVAQLYTFGAPPVGNTAFCDALDAYFPDNYFRVVTEHDMVPRALVDSMTWRDIGPSVPLWLQPLVLAFKQKVRSAKFFQGGRLVEIQEVKDSVQDRSYSDQASPAVASQEARLPERSLVHRSAVASRHDIRRYWQKMSTEKTGFWQMLGRQGQYHHNSAYLAALSQLVKPAVKAGVLRRSVRCQSLPANLHVLRSLVDRGGASPSVG
jgi:thioesterase domain-containing protein